MWVAELLQHVPFLSSTLEAVLVQNGLVQGLDGAFHVGVHVRDEVHLGERSLANDSLKTIRGRNDSEALHRQTAAVGKCRHLRGLKSPFRSLGYSPSVGVGQRRFAVRECAFARLDSRMREWTLGMRMGNGHSPSIHFSSCSPSPAAAAAAVIVEPLSTQHAQYKRGTRPCVG